MSTSAILRASATPAVTPDIIQDPGISAEVVETFRLSGAAPTAVVKITATASVVITALVSPTRVIVPSLRGIDIVHFEDRTVAQQAAKAALSAYTAFVQDKPSGEVTS